MTTAVAINTSVRARAAAIAWLNAFLATGDDDERPALYKTLLVEVFETGVQFVATNGHLMFRTWAPTIDADANNRAAWPKIGDRPMRALVVYDSDGFGVGFMRTLLRATSDEVGMTELLTMSLSKSDEDGVPLLGDEFTSERLTLCACGLRIDLKLFEGEYPQWRGAAAVENDKPLSTPDIRASTRLLGLIGKLKEVMDVTLAFHGPEGPVVITSTIGTVPTLHGILMPMRAAA